MTEISQQPNVVLVQNDMGIMEFSPEAVKLEGDIAWYLTDGAAFMPLNSVESDQWSKSKVSIEADESGYGFEITFTELSITKTAFINLKIKEG